MNAADKITDASERLERTANENGGAYQEPEGYRGSVARTMFDRPGSEDGTITILVPEHQIGNVSREAYVRIDSMHPRTNTVEAQYLGVVGSGPFAEPDALGANAPTLVVAAAHGAVLTPKYHGIAHVEVFGEKVDGVVIPPLKRPCPNSPVFLLGQEDTKAVLGLDVAAEDKPVRLGLLGSVSSISVEVPAAKKSVLYKHVAILGTTGGGKSTTVSGSIMNFAGAGNAVVVFDIEGEYTTMNEPTQNPHMLAALKKRGLSEAGAPKTRLFYLSGRTSANPRHPDKREFKIAFDDLSPYVLAEVLDLSEPQERRLLEAYDICRITMEREKIYPATPEEHAEALEIDELQRGWPRMTIEKMIDVVAAAIDMIEGGANGFKGRVNGFRDHETVLLQTLNARKIEKDSRSWKAIAKRLWRMKSAGVFANGQQERIRVDDMLEPGRISIVDLSDMDAPYLRNLVIAQILRLLQSRQDDRYAEREEQVRKGAEGKPLTRVNIFIEEAHEFLSAQRIKQMPNLFDQVARIARRGRKRYLGLVFVTQLPSHLPDEVLGLVNNWILHKLTDGGVVNRLKKVVPGVNEATWRSLPNLAPGQALCSLTHLTRPVMVAIDPSPCQLRMVD
ncbi:ATP-binding protein [Rhizobium sp. WYCCWR 11279]|uniref:ATP-binding protein n=1 Tax=Rhizobium changzhiense TaxID=2692317 RepID=UPI001490C26C|nr:ATP-binding protein [Rhizobium changzhiense]NNU50448.1 ATP-binding protein [Rhizobium changzhiense]